jgi:hypothetical protein
MAHDRSGRVIPGAFGPLLLQEIKMHTEQEAKELWCPHARVFHFKFAEESTDAFSPPQAHPAHNRLVIDMETDTDAVCACDFDNLKCIASRCMAWRWEGEKAAREVEAGREPLGYCGLSGKP